MFHNIVISPILISISLVYIVLSDLEERRVLLHSSGGLSLPSILSGE